jgi:hypothetical protein
MYSNEYIPWAIIKYNCKVNREIYVDNSFSVGEITGRI